MKRALVFLENGATVILPHVFYRQPGDGDFENANSLYGWERAGRGIKPKTAALLMLAWWTNGYQPTGFEITNNYCRATFAGPTTRCFLWAKEGTVASVNPPKDTDLRDIYGNPVSDQGSITDEVTFFDSK